MKSNITFKLFINKRKTKTDGSIPVYLRITQNRKYRLITTGISIDEKHWNPDKSEIRKNHPRYRALNSQLEQFVYDAKQAAAELPKDKQKIRVIKETLSKAEKPDSCFFEYAERFYDTLKKQNRYWAEKHTRVTVGFFSDYLKKSSYPFDAIDHLTLEGFNLYLKQVKGNNVNTVHKHFQAIKRIYNQALLDDVIKVNPFDKFKPDSRQKSEKTRLSFDQIKAIAELKLNPRSWQDIARDAFLFSFYNAGIRFGDIARLQWKHVVDGRLKYNMAKTGTGKNIKLLSPALEILDKYRPDQRSPEAFIFPILKPDHDLNDEPRTKRQISSKNVITNKNLKKLAQMAGIEDNISFHVSRHSFADYARTAGMGLYDISKALGHADIQITQAYLKSFDETSLDLSMEKLFS